MTAPSLTFDAFYEHHPVTVTYDTRANDSMIQHSVAVRMGMFILPTSHTASQADGKTKLSLKRTCVSYK